MPSSSNLMTAPHAAVAAVHAFEQADGSTPAIWTDMATSRPLHSSSRATAGGKCNELPMPVDIALHRSQVEAQERLRQDEQELQRLRRQVWQLQDSLEKREFELSTHPTHRDVQQLRNHICRLERELHPEREALRKITDTRELIRSDKRKLSVGRQRCSQGLESLSAVSREDLEKTVLAVCAALKVSKLDEVARSVQNLADIVEQHLPRLEKFTSKVFEIVQEAQAAPKDAASEPSVGAPRQRPNAEEVLATLRAWRSGCGSEPTAKQRISPGSGRPARRSAARSGSSKGAGRL